MDPSLLGFTTTGYWMDIGTMEKYLQVHLDILNGAAPFRAQASSSKPGLLAQNGVKIGSNVSHDGVSKVLLGVKTLVGPYVRFSGGVCIGERCVIGQGSVLKDCVVLGGALIGEGVNLNRCVIGRECRVGAHASLGPGRALGDRSVVARFSQL